MGFQMVKIFLTSSDLQRSRSNPKNFEVKYLKNGMRERVRERESVSIKVR